MIYHSIALSMVIGPPVYLLVVIARRIRQERARG